MREEAENCGNCRHGKPDGEIYRCLRHDHDTTGFIRCEDWRPMGYSETPITREEFEKLKKQIQVQEKILSFLLVMLIGKLENELEDEKE